MGLVFAHRVALSASALGLVICLVIARPAQAATFTWSGGSTGTGIWDTSSNNWSGATGTPLWDQSDGTANSALFSNGGTAANATGNNLYVNNLTFASPATNGLINGGTLNVYGNISDLNTSAGTDAIGSTVVFNAGTTTLTCTSSKNPLLFSGPVTTSGNVTMTGSGIFAFGGGTVNIPGTLQEASGSSVSPNEIISVLPGTTMTCGTYSVGTYSALTVNGTMNTNSIQCGNSTNGNQLLNGGGVINTQSILGTSNGGTIEFSKGLLNVSGSALIGRITTGTARSFQQDSGTVSVTSAGDGFTIGNGATSATTTGAYTMTGGSLSVPNEYVELCWSAAGVLSEFQVSGSAGTAATANVYGISFGSTVNSGTQNGNGLLKLGNAGSLLVIGSGGIIGGSSGNLQIQLGSGTLASSAPWSTPTTVPITLIGNGNGLTNIDASAGTVTLSGAISGTKGLQEIGSGLLVLNNPSTNYTGPTTVSGGTLQLGDGITNIGGMASNISTSGGAVVLFAVPTGMTQTYSNSMSGAGSLVVAGPGVLTLNNTNNIFSGGTTISAGTLQLGDGFSSNGSLPGPITNNAGLVFANPQPQTFAGVIGGSGAVFVNGPGSLALSGSNAFSGGVTLASGQTLYVNSNNALGTGTLTINGGIIDSTTAGVALGNVPQNWNADFTFGGTNNLNLGTGAVLISNSSRTITLNGGVLTVGGPISDGGAGYSLSVTSPSGTGMLVLGGASSYSGGTNVNSGALVVNGALTGSGGVMVQSGGTLAGNGLVSGGGATLAGSATLSPGPSPLPGSIGTFTASSLSIGSGATIAFDLSNSAAGAGNDLVNVTGSLSLPNSATLAVNATAGSLAQNASYTLFDYGSLTATGSPLAYSGPLGARQQAIFNYGTGLNSAITLSITGYFANLVWTGAGTNANTWDQNNTTNYCWTSSQHPAGDFFASLDNVRFDGTSTSGHQTVTLDYNGGNPLTPSSILVTGTKNYTFQGSGQIGGATALTVAGPGSLTIQNANNSYTGGTNIQGGAIILGTYNALPPSGTVTFGAAASNGTLDLAGNSQTVGGLAVAPGATASAQIITDSTGLGTLTYSSTISSTFGGTIQDTAPTGLLTLEVSNGQLVLSGNNTYAGGTIVNGGTLQLGVPNALPTSGNITASNTGTLDLGGNGQTTSGTVNLQGGTVQNGTLTSSVAAFNGQSGTVTANLAGPVALNMSGGGMLVIGGTGNSYTGGTNISGGVLQLGVANALPTGGNITVYSGGTFDLGGVSQSTSGVVSFQGGTVQDGTLTSTNLPFDGQSGTVTANLAGGVGLNKTTAGQLTLGGSASYTGNTVVAAGILQLGSTSGVPHGPTAGMLELDGGALSAGTVDVNGLSPDIGGLTGAAGAVPGMIVNNGYSSGTLTVGDNNSTSTFSGTLVDGYSPLALNKSGSGTLTLNGTNTYSGGTTVSQGILVPTSTAAFGTVTNSTYLTIGANGELQLPAGGVTSVGNVYVAGSGVTGLGTINGGTLNVLGSNVTMTGSKGTANISPPTILTAASTTLTCTNSKATLLFSSPLSTSVSNSGSITASGSGNFVFSGGTVNIYGTLTENSQGAVISVPAGTALNCGDYHSNSATTLTIGGTMTTDSISSGNSRSAGNLLLNGSGVINTSTIYGTTDTGTIEFSNGVLNVSSSAIIGRVSNSGSGRSFQQDSGTVTVTGTGDGFTVGLNATSATSAYTMNGGTLNVPYEYVELCYSSAGTAAQSAFQVLGSAGAPATANIFGISLGQTVNNGVQNGNGLVKLGNAGSLLAIGAGGIIAASSGSLQVQLGGGTLASSAPWSTTMPITLNGNAATNINASAGTITLGGPISGTKGLQEIGSGVLVLGGTNTYTGGTTISSGLMQLGNSAALGTGALAANGGTLDLNGNSVLVPSFSGAAGVVTTSAPSLAATLSVNQPLATTFGGTIADGAGQLSLALSGAATLYLTGTNTYTGGTYVEGSGTLIVSNNDAIDGNNMGNNNLYVGSDLSAFGGVIPAGGSSPAAEYPWAATAPAMAPVPEPGTLALAAAAGGALLMLRRRRRA